MKNKGHQFLNPLSPSSMYPLNEVKIEIEFGTDEGDRGFTKKRHNRLKVKHNVKVKTYDHKQTGQPVAMVSGTKQDVVAHIYSITSCGRNCYYEHSSGFYSRTYT